MRKLIFGLTIATLVCSATPAFSHGKHLGPSHDTQLIRVPDGFQPEGVARGHGTTAYVGSLKTGGIYRVDLRNGEGELLVPSADTPAVGLAYDRRSNYLFVAGGPSGTVTVYDATDGQQKSVFALNDGSNTFINDGIVTREAAYFTDSFAPVIYKLPLGKNGRLPDANEVEALQLSSDFEMMAGGFNANGIEASKDGKILYVVNSITGKLYQVDPMNGNSREVEISNGNVMNGDGLLFIKNKLYVVQNYDNQVAELRLSHKGMKARINRLITDDAYKIPTTATAFGNTLYVINARFDVAPPPLFGTPPADPTLVYELVGVRLNH